MNGGGPGDTGARRSTRAVLLEAGGTSRLGILELPAPGPGELILELEACGLCGTDLVKIQRRRAAPGGEEIVLGHEVVGRVVEAGEGAAVPVGARVVVAHHVACGRCRLCRHDAETSCPTYREDLLQPGGFSELLKVRRRAVEEATFLFSEDRDAAGLLFLEPLACVLRAIRRAKLSAPSRVAVFGCGSTGLLHLLALRALDGDHRVTMVDPLDHRRRRATELGADEVLDRLDDGDFDAVFDTVGSPDVLHSGIRSLRPGGRLVLFAHHHPGPDPTLPIDLVFRNELSVTSSYSSGQEDRRQAYNLLADSSVRPDSLVTHRLTLGDFGRGVDLAREREALKVLLTP